MEHILINEKGRNIHRCFKDRYDNTYTQEGCNIDDTSQTKIIPITYSAMKYVIDLVDVNDYLLCARCFPIEGLN